MKLSDKFKYSEKVAIVRTDKLGDMVLTLPLVRALKEYRSEIITTVIANSYTEILLKNKFTDKYYFIDKYPGGINAIFKTHNFDAVFFPMPVFSEVKAAYLNRIPIRIGSSYRLYSFMFNHKVHDHRKVSEFHEAEYNVRMLESVTGAAHSVNPVPPLIDIYLLKHLQDFSESLKKDSSGKIILIHPGSGGSAKDLPVSTTIDYLNKLSENDKYTICLSGIKSEEEICRHISENVPGITNLCGKFNLDEMIAFMKFCDLLIANSTGVLHIAASIGTPVLGFFPNTPHISAKRWGPLWTKSKVICPPAGTGNNNDDMSMINTDDILEAVYTLIK